jgi:hypothetical protein
MRLTGVIILLLFASCNSNIKFNSEKWSYYESGVIGGDREKMLDDLTNNIIKPFKTKKSEIDSLIGQPEKTSKLDSSLVYLVTEKYGWNIDPEGYIYLKLFFNKDSIVQHWAIEETTFNP